MKLEVLQKDKFYHIYNKGINGCNIFNSDENKSYFLKLVSKYLTDKVSILAYCLMDNHFHFVIQIVDDEKIVSQTLSIIYIHLNPTHHLNINFTDYKFSSYQDILNEKESIIFKNEVLELFDDIDNYKYCHNSKRQIIEDKYLLD